MNLERRIRRHVIGARHDFFATALPGCETHCRDALARLPSTIVIRETVRGGVVFSGRLTDMYLSNLHLRTAGRVLLRLAEFRATAFRHLEKKASAIAWNLYLPRGEIPHLRVSCRRSRLRHTGAITQRLQGCIARHWTSCCAESLPEPTQHLYVRLVDDRATISLDSSGDNLYRRGLKTHRASAPLRETTAAAILLHAGYHPGRVLVDPMCGSGTFSLEAAMMAKAIPPGFHRRFAFMQWPAFRQRQWRHLKNTAVRAFRQLKQPTIYASDLDPAACEDLRACAAANGLQDAVRVQTSDFFSLQADHLADTPGLVVLNPPYGRRLDAGVGPERFYRQLGAKLRCDFKQWQIALLAPGPRLAKALQLPLKPLKLAHGGLNVILLTGRL